MSKASETPESIVRLSPTDAANKRRSGAVTDYRWVRLGKHNAGVGFLDPDLPQLTVMASGMSQANAERIVAALRSWDGQMPSKSS